MLKVHTIAIFSNEQRTCFFFSENSISSWCKESFVIRRGAYSLKYLKDFIERINFIYPDMQIVIITNGLLFSSNSFNSKMENLNFKVNLSVKASNEEQHRKLTKTNSFKNVSKAIRLLVEKRRLTGVSVTVNNKVINNLEEITEMVFENGVPLLLFEMCVPIFDSENRPQKDYVIKPCKLARKLELTYGNIMKISKGKIIYQLSIPFCLFSSDFISDLKK